jgi:GT2 family glycosyltransferase
LSNPLVTINLVVLNGEKYVRYCLDGILAQIYPHEFIEFNIIDNGSTDSTKSVIENFKLKIKNSSFVTFNLIEGRQNLGMWPGQEELLKYSKGKYVLAMAVDVILDKDFIKNAVEIMENNLRLGALEAKIYKYDLTPQGPTLTDILDTCGFKVDRARRFSNIGHGEKDRGQYDGIGEIFGVEGAAPFFRREAMEHIRINGDFCDHDYFWYGDDLDLAWRMNLFGWKQIFAPTVIAWHDRQTTKSLRKNSLDYLSRIPTRRKIPLRKRRLDWRNTRFTIIKNEYIINALRDLPQILIREVMVFVYTLFVEPGVFLEAGNFFRLLPKMLKRRKIIMDKAIREPREIHKFFQ